MRIAIIANCQGESVALCINAMTSGHQADFILATEFTNGAKDIKDVLCNYDLIFAQNFARDSVTADVAHKVHFFPSIVFPGFHPDMTFARGRRNGGDLETVASPMIIYHSAIVLYGFVSGKTPDETVALLNTENFERLGYFDQWNKSVSDLLEEGRAVGMPLSAHLDRWIRRGCFMHTFNHPRLHTMVDITRELLLRANIEIRAHNVDHYLTDPMLNMSTWPVYPPVAARLDLPGDYLFNLPSAQGCYGLQQFVEHCFGVYGQYDVESLETLNVRFSDIKAAFERMDEPEATPTAMQANPYRNIRREQFWKNSVAGVAPSDLDPVMTPKFRISPTDKVATAGSCFAQHIARTLARSGFNYFVPEQARPGAIEMEIKERNYGVFSARYGNIYTVRQLLPRPPPGAGRFVPRDVAWKRRDGRLADPFRPQIEPAGFLGTDALRASRCEHFEAVRRMLQQMDVFVFTLGLTEGWRSRQDGAVFPLAPGVAAGEMDRRFYEFINFSAQQITEDLKQVIDRIWVINPACRILMTVSPVPLIATYEPSHALVATTYSKSVLRTAAEIVKNSYGHVDYFPSFEIITGAYTRGRYFEDDLREVTEEGVNHVMRVFMSRYTQTDQHTQTDQPEPSMHEKPFFAPPIRERSAMFEVVCDEEAIANSVMP